MKLIKLIIWIGELSTRVVMLCTLGSLLVLGVLYTVAFWGAVFYREISLNDLKMYYIGLLFFILAIAIASSLFLVDTEYEIQEKEEADCDTCGIDEVTHITKQGAFCTRCWNFWKGNYEIQSTL